MAANQTAGVPFADDRLIEPPTTLEVARERVTHLFELNCWDPLSANEDVQAVASEVVGLLRSFPVLASEKFTWATAVAEQEQDFRTWQLAIAETPGTSVETQYHPLAFFVLSNSDLVSLERVFSMYPTAISENQGYSRSLIHCACRFANVNDETLIWLLSKCDHELLSNRQPITRKAPEYTPFQSHLQTRRRTSSFASLEVIKGFLDLTGSWNGGPSFILSQLLALGYSDEQVLDYIVRLMPSKSGSLILSHHGRHMLGFNAATWWKFDRKQAKAVGQALPKIENLYCNISVSNWTVEGWHQLLHTIAENRTLPQLCLFLPTAFLSNHPKCLESLRFLFQNIDSTFLQSIKLVESHLNQDVITHKAFVQAMVEGLELNPNDSPLIREMCLYGLGGLCPSNLTKLGPFTHAIEVRDANLDLFVPTKDRPNSTAMLWHGLSAVRPLCVSTKYEHQHLTYANLDLEVLEYDGVTDGIVSDATVALLNHSPLKEMRINNGGRVQVELFRRALKQNTTLECLHLNDFRFLPGGIHNEFSVTDITSTLITMLEHPALKKIYISDCFGTPQHTRHELQVLQLRDALKANVFLEELKLHQIRLCHDGVDDTPLALLSILEGGSTKLHTLEASENYETAFTFRYGTDAGWHQSNSHNLSYSAKILYTLCLNRYGRHKLPSNPACTARDLVSLFAKAEADTRRRIQAEMSYFVHSLVYNFRFGKTFEHLRSNPSTWCWTCTGEDPLDTVSANFGLLREVPGLWCRTKTIRRKRKHRELS